MYLFYTFYLNSSCSPLGGRVGRKDKSPPGELKVLLQKYLDIIHREKDPELTEEV